MNWLPPESAYKTALRDHLGPDALAKSNTNDGGDVRLGVFSQTDMHLGQIIDELRWTRYAIYHAQGGKPRKPSQYPRPGVALGKRTALSEAQRDYLDELRAQRPPPPTFAHVPHHIGNAQPKKLGPAEREWIVSQLDAMTH